MKFAPWEVPNERQRYCSHGVFCIPRGRSLFYPYRGHHCNWLKYLGYPEWNASPALIMVMWGLDQVRHAKTKPGLRGIILGVGYTLIGLVVVFLKDASPLWAMILVDWLVEYID